MKVVCSEWNLQIELMEGRVHVLLVENSTFLVDIINDLYGQSKGEEGRILLWNKNEVITFNKNADLIINPFSLDFNGRKIQSRLMQELNEIAMDQCANETAVIRTEIINYLERVTSHLPYNIVFADNFEMTSFFKCMSTQLSYYDQSFVDKICSYMKIMHQLCGVVLFVFVNLSQYLSENQFSEFEREIAYMGIYVLFIESKIENEFHYSTIVDRDLCVIKLESE